MGLQDTFGGSLDLFLGLAGNIWAHWPLFTLDLGSCTWFLNLELDILVLKNYGLILDFLNLADLKERNKGIEPNKPTIYRSAVGNWACWAKLISEVAQIQGPKRWIVCRHTTFQQLVYGDAALISFAGLDPIFVCQEVNSIVRSKHSFSEAGYNLTL